MPLNLVIGPRGFGKTSFLVFQGWNAYFVRGYDLKHHSAELVADINEKYGYNLTPPDDVPIFTSPKLPMRFIIGWYKYYEPYMINPYYIGTNNNGGKPIMYTPPGSVYLIPEFHEIVNSRKSGSFPDTLTQWFAESRQWDIEFWGDGQRAHLMDKNFREIVDRIYEMQGMKNDTDKLGRTIKSTWYCHEFPNMKAFDENRYVETQYEFRGNIFEFYDSKQCKTDFIPPKGADFKYLKHVSALELQSMPKSEAALYSMDAPDWFRKNKNDEKEEAN